MIPVRLAMRNFMCYRDSAPALHFDGIHLACLSGDNGNGKSAIIDALTWALWGKARTNSDDDLISTGQPDMEVEFDFVLGGQLYRIIRKRSRPRRERGTGQSVLEFQVSDGNGFRPITGNTIPQTQQDIIAKLHMDFDTFINSAYLRQGHADEFTIKRPAERKEVLADILGLSVYDELEDRAREMAKQQEAARIQLESSFRDIAEELAHKPACEEELRHVQEELAAIEAATREKETSLNDLRKKKEALENTKARLDDLEARAAQTAGELERWEAQGKQHRSRVGEYEEIIMRRAAIEEVFGRFTATKETSEELDRKFRQSVGLERQRAQLDARIKEAGHSLSTEHAVIQREINNLEDRLKKLPELKNRLAQAQARMSELVRQEAALRERDEVIRTSQGRISYLESEMKQLERDISGLDEKLGLLASRESARCPLCETELSGEGIELITGKYAQERQEKTARLESDRAELLQKHGELKTLHEERREMESRLNREKADAQSQAGIASREIAEIDESGEQLAGARENLEEIEGRMVAKDFARAEQEALASVEAELVGLEYDAEKHEEVRRQIVEMEPCEQEKRKLDEAVRLIEQEKEAVAGALEAVKRLRSRLEDDNSKKEALTRELTQLPGLINELTVIEGEYRELSARQSQSRETVGRVKARLQRYAELEIKKKEKEEQMSGAGREENIYKELARAFGKGGIQAMLIETALPEIEDEANLLLARMTDNRMHVKFEPQRETRKGNVIETLDINIADELGTRNYEMFSGGEAFRINFAIRIALSRLLARRAGAPLRTLIIDEGFGTQDSSGLEKLKEAIISIQGDFDKILVITHVEELRDAFPTRIDISRTPSGSTISVN